MNVGPLTSNKRDQNCIRPQTKDTFGEYFEMSDAGLIVIGGEEGQGGGEGREGGGIEVHSATTLHDASAWADAS